MVQASLCADTGAVPGGPGPNSRPPTTGKLRVFGKLPAWTEPWLAGFMAFALHATFLWRPSLWFDEAASIAAADRSEREIFRMLLNVDVVHGAYYFLLHYWLSFLPVTAFTVRLPSAIAVGAGAAGIIVLCRLIADRQIAWMAAIVFTVLPRIISVGIEARSYAITAALAIWLTIVFAVAARRRGGALWTLYALVLTLATATHLYLALMPAVHLAAMLTRRRMWRSLPAFATAAAAGLACAYPLVVVAMDQSKQISWINSLKQNHLKEIFFEQWFAGTRIFTVTAVAIAIVGIVMLVRKRPEAWHGFAWWLSVSWCVIPSVLLAGYSVLIDDVYLARYLTFTAPGFAIFLAFCIRAMTGNRTRMTTAVLLALALAAAPTFIVHRDAYHKPFGTDYSAVADLLSAKATAGECVLFDIGNPLEVPGLPRAAAVAYPRAYKDLVDVTAGPSGTDIGWLFILDLPMNHPLVSERLARCSQVWAITALHGPAPVTDDAVKHGFRIAERFTLHRSVVVLLSRA